MRKNVEAVVKLLRFIDHANLVCNLVCVVLSSCLL